jgi:glycosyltransferase involved in cell wall biosynthesis
MNWIPNLEGIKWFIREAWEKVAKLKPEVTLHLAGRSMPDWLINIKTKGIIIDGEVPDARKYMEKYPIMVVPLFSGSGIRIKIIEGMLSQCAIITTSIGAEGIEYIDGKHLIIANDKSQFINAIKKLTENSDLASEIGRQARQFVIENHDNRKLMKNLEIFYLKVNDQI